MSSRLRASTRRMIRVLALVAVAVAAGCTPGPGAVPTSPAPGCHDNLSGPTVRDVWYTGEPADINNLRVWSSTDGSCSGVLIDTPAISSTVIVTDRPADAAFLCRAYFGDAANAGPFDQRTGPWSPTFGPNANTCDPVR